MPDLFGLVKVETIMAKLTVYLAGDSHAEVKDGEVVGWKPLTIKTLNENIDTCIDYLKEIKEAIDRSKEG